MPAIIISERQVKPMKQSELLSSISQLTQYQRKAMETYIIDALRLNKEVENTRPTVCPYCNHKANFIKKGFSHGKQRYQCKECHHVFTYNSHTITMYSKIERSMFLKILLDTLNCVPIKDTAAELDLSIPCVFENRHKILCALEYILDMECQKLSGTVEIDETYELECQKGMRNITRKARKRGGPSAYRGISHEQVCIVTTTDRNGHEIFKAVGLGKPTTDSILENFSKSLAEKSILYTDGAFSYDQLAKENECTLVQLKTYKAYNKVEHLNTVNCIHSLIKQTLAYFRGVSTKYINRYLSLFVFIRRYLDMDNNEKLPLIIRKLNTYHFTITRNGLKDDLLLNV